MESEVKESMSPLSKDTPGMMTTTSNTTGEEVAWQEYLNVAVTFVSDLPDELGSFFENYKKFLINTGVILLAFIVVFVTFAVLDALNSLPLVSPILELIGLGYLGWFAFRYLLSDSSRTELRAEFNSITEQLFGGGENS